MKVKIEFWDMQSEPGYVPNSGWARAFILPADEVAGMAKDELYEFAKDTGDVVRRSDCQDIEGTQHQTGACIYRGWEGTLDVADGEVAVQLYHSDISTSDHVHYGAVILNEISLVELYEERARKYQMLAEEARKENQR